MPSRKRPCVRCKERHEKCDEGQPKCARCEKNGVDCLRPERELKLRRADSESFFSQDQSWVSSRARRFKLDRQTRERIRHENHTTQANAQTRATSPESSSSVASASRLPVSRTEVTGEGGKSRGSLGGLPPSRPLVPTSITPPSDYVYQSYPTPTGESSSLHESNSMNNDPKANINTGPTLDGASTIPYDPYEASVPYSVANKRVGTSPYAAGDGKSTTASERQGALSFSHHEDAILDTPYHVPWAAPHDLKVASAKPLKHVEEACLVRFFIEEIAGWFDLCDPHQSFQRVVAPRAHFHTPLRHAICAVSAYLITRMPRSLIRRSMSYLQPVIPHLHPQSGYEYMLLCIPALRDINDIHDEANLDNLAAAALILRQFEEITIGERDDEEDKSENGVESHVNFLKITDAILRSAPNPTSLIMNSVYWIVLRQEIYFSFYVGRAPEISTVTGREHTASLANRVILQAADVGRWKYGGGRSLEEWERLKLNLDALEVECQQEYIPLLSQPADWSQGETFPVKWYASDIEVTAIQHLLLAKAVLIADDPTLRAQGTRSGFRNAEHQVRILIMEICGLAIHHLRMPTHLATTAVAITQYGEFFSDPRERSALEALLDMLKTYRVWSTRRAYESLGLPESPRDTGPYSCTMSH